MKINFNFEKMQNKNVVTCHNHRLPILLNKPWISHCSSPELRKDDRYLSSLPSCTKSNTSHLSGRRIYLENYELLRKSLLDKVGCVLKEPHHIWSQKEGVSGTKHFYWVPLYGTRSFHASFQHFLYCFYVYVKWPQKLEILLRPLLSFEFSTILGSLVPSCNFVLLCKK